MTSEQAEALVRRVAGLATAAMLLASWRLWVGLGDIPRVPFLPALIQTTGTWAWLLFVALVVAIAISAMTRFWTPWYALSLALLVILIGQDQHRFQPWAFQYAMTLFFLASLPTGEGLRYARWWFVSIYLHSGLSKLDVSFCDELGPVFLRAGLSPLGIDPSRWATGVRSAAVMAMPSGEMVVALALLAPRLRRLGRIGVVALHAGLIAILGPTGLGHSSIVLAWNAVMAVEVWIAFGPDLGLPEQAFWRDRWTWPVKGVFWLGVILPLGERWGLWDAWPSHALYASHVDWVSVRINESTVMSYPASVRARLAGEPPWLRLDLNSWSLAERGTPVYPQNRACLGLAEALAARYGGPLPVRVIAFGGADRWTGRRSRTVADGFDEIREMGGRYRCNAHPWINWTGNNPQGR